MSHIPAVTVIIPAWNASSYIRQCMNSVLNQTLKNIQIICVDDGSSDDTLSILQEYVRKDRRVQVISQPNGGAGSARNNAIQYAEGKYLSFLDSDDFFEPNMLEMSYSAAENKDAEIVVFGCDYYTESSSCYRRCPNSINRLLLPSKEVFSLRDVRKDSFRLFVGWAWDKLIRTDLVKKHALTFQKQRTTNDMLFVFSALVLAERITVLSNLLAHHRRTEISLSVTREQSWDCFYYALLALRDHLRDYGVYEQMEQDYINYALHFSLWQLNSLAEPTYTVLYQKLREEWFDSLGIAKYPEKLFYNRHEYAAFRRIYGNSKFTVRSDFFKKWADGSLVQRALKGIADNGLKYTAEYLVLMVLDRIYTKR